MQAFHNDPKIKKKYLARVQAHFDADEIIKGQYWENGKGCAVGCTIHGSSHKDYETELGIPEWLARLEDTLFENLQNGRSKRWPIDFLSAIKPGADLEKVKTPFLIFILEQNLKYLDALPDMSDHKDVEAAIKGSRAAVLQMIEAHKNGSDLSAASAARSAWSAARSAESAAESAAWSAESAWSAARSAESAAWSAASAESAAESAAWSAWSAAWSAESAWSAARSAAYEKYADKLIELLKECE